MSGAFGDMGNLLKQAQRMQRELSQLQDSLRAKHVEATSGGGAVVATANAAGELVAIRIDPEVVNREEVSMLEDLVVAAVGAALKKANALHQEEVARITGGLNLPGLF
jgi:hypothetical protein